MLVAEPALAPAAFLPPSLLLLLRSVRALAKLAWMEKGSGDPGAVPAGQAASPDPAPGGKAA